MSNDVEDRNARLYQVLTKHHNLGIFVGLFFGLIVSREIREAFRDSAGYWGSLGVAIVLSALSAGVVAYVAFKLLDRKSSS
ncbi:hypothetical protein [Gimesia panareensis]|uniref:hypothetical protein n=1 Tax=Gimesia panareensis TaxID=2527978 RepID=UPI00118AA2F5|nr:hypothetical protein [Gimesia panareensis]QDU53243.1 hypothetical protein Pan110_56280 [Gimesia panareensis]